MPDKLQKYTEPLTVEELHFLERKEAKNRTMYYQVFRVLMVLSFIIPFAGAWYRAADGVENAFSVTKFFVTNIILLSISSVSTYATYRLNLRKLQLDTRDKTKTIEITHVKRKVQFPSKNEFYFYIDSGIKMSIEVSQKDYLQAAIGDEVCIEYATHSREYFGYF